VTVAPNAGQKPLLDKATANLKAFYHPLTFPYGPQHPTRYLSISDVVGQVEAAGPQGISVKSGGGKFNVKFVIGGVEFGDDVRLDIGEMPSLGQVTLTVVA
jgi:hypothetical protein